MAKNLSFNIKFGVTGDGKVNAIVEDLNGGLDKVKSAVGGVDEGFKKTVDSMNAGIKRIQWSSILDQVDRVTNAMNNMAQPGLDYSSSLAEVEAITGVTGAALDDLGAKARNSAKEFGGSATDSLNSYKVILSRLGPDIASVPEALEGMEHHVRTLSKTMDGDATASVDALTTAMLQYGVDLSDPIEASAQMEKMMNVMAAGAQKGSAEVTSIAQAVKVAGVAMSQANVTFEEGNAALQALAKGGKEGSEAGTGLRNILGKMAGEDVIPKQAQEKLRALGVDMGIVSDTTLPLTDRLGELKKAQSDATIMAQVFGVENAATANILLNSIDAQRELTAEITGTNTASEQAAVIMESKAEKAERLRAQMEDLKISIFNATNGFIGYAGVVGDMVKNVMNIIPLLQGFGAVISFVTSREKLLSLWTGITSASLKVKAGVLGIVTAATWLWNIAQSALNITLWANPVTWIVLGIVALIGTIIYLVTQLEGWGDAWSHLMDAMTSSMMIFVNYFKLQWRLLVDGIMIGLNYIQAGWYKFKNAVGLGDESENNAMLAKINADTESRKKAISDAADAVAQSTKDAYNSFGKIGGSLSWKEESDETSPIAKAIAPPSVPGTADNPLASAMQSGSSANAGKSDSGKQTNQAVATGGSKTTTVNLTFKNFVETLKIEGKSFKESTNKMEKELNDAMLRTLAMANAAAG